MSCIDDAFSCYVTHQDALAFMRIQCVLDHLYLIMLLFIFIYFHLLFLIISFI